MIEDKELGLKVAEDPIEVLWIRVRDSTKKRIEELENTLIVEKAVVEMSEEKLKEWKTKA